MVSRDMNMILAAVLYCTGHTTGYCNDIRMLHVITECRRFQGELWTSKPDTVGNPQYIIEAHSHVTYICDPK